MKMMYTYFSFTKIQRKKLINLSAFKCVPLCVCVAYLKYSTIDQQSLKNRETPFACFNANVGQPHHMHKLSSTNAHYTGLHVSR